MKPIRYINAMLAAILLLVMYSNAQTMKKPLTDFEKFVIVDKGTERPFIGEYTNLKDKGTYWKNRCVLTP